MRADLGIALRHRGLREAQLAGVSPARASEQGGWLGATISATVHLCPVSRSACHGARPGQGQALWAALCAVLDLGLRAVPPRRIAQGDQRMFPSYVKLDSLSSVRGAL